MNNDKELIAIRKLLQERESFLKQVEMLIETEKEILRLRESFLKQVMTISSAGLAILIGLFEKFITAGVGSLWYYSAIAFWLVAICIALFAQSKLSWYFNEATTLRDRLSENDALMREVLKKCELLDSKKIYESNMELAESTIEELDRELTELGELLDEIGTINQQRKKTDMIIVSFCYVSLACFFLGAFCISLGVYNIIP